MPRALHNGEIALNDEVVWEFLKDYNNWAPLVSGYIGHDVQSDSQFTWIFSADLGFTKKTIKLQVDISELVSPSDVKFQLKGLSDNFSGNGYFKAAAKAETTEITGCLDLSAGGMMGMMINSVLESFMPKMTQELVDAISTKLSEPSVTQ
jgi:carbon monoxide dehydrogenase subunit G